MSGKNEIVAGIRLDGEKEYKSAITSINKETKSLKSELSLIKAQYDGQQNSLEALTKKHEVLNRLLVEQAKKVDETKKGLDHAKESYENAGKELDTLRTKLEKATEEMKDMEKTYGESSDEVKNQRKVVDELSAAVSKGEENYRRAGNRVKDWETDLNNASSQLIKANNEVNKNAKYMKEAENAADKCATSIDGFGKALNKVETDTFKDSFMANLASAAVQKGIGLAAAGLGKVKDVAVEAAKATVEVGSNFKAAMSEVAAISNATNEELRAMSDKAKALGSSTRFSATEVANGFKYMSLAGWETQDMLAGIDGVVNLAAAANMDLAAASDMVTDYLSAFNMEASESAKMADMLAYAQSHSNASVEQIGESYANCAANMNAAGQDIETTTSFLEAMANQGEKGSSAGTKLSAVMRDITAKMKDGKIEIGDTSVAVADANGNYRDMTDILTDVETATEGMGDAEKNVALSSTFTAKSLGAVNLILNEGMDKIAGYEQELRNCDGAAEKMAATMQDNLKGDITEMNSALEGLGIAAYGYVDGPLRGVVQGVTGIIGGITDVLDPQKTELETFISEVKTSNEEVQTLLDNASDTMSGAEMDVSELETYRDTILSLMDVENKDEFQKYQLKNAVEVLSGSIPELSEAYDVETGKIDLTKEAVDGLFESQEKIIMQQATMEAKETAYKAYADAKINEAKATAAVKAAQEEYNDTLEDTDKKMKEFAENGMDSSGLVAESGKAAGNVKEAEKALTDAKEATKKAKGEVEILESAIGELGLTEEEGTETTSEMSEAQDSLGTSAQDAAVKIAASADTQKAAFDSVMETYNSTMQSIEEDIQNKINPFDKFDGGTDMTVEDMLSNLKSQTEGLQKYKENLATITEAMGSEIAPEFLQYIESMGVDGANMLQHLVDTLSQDDGVELIREMSEEYVAAMDMSEEIARTGAVNEVAYQASIRELGSSAEEFADLGDIINEALSSAEADTDWGNITRGEKEALEEALRVAQECGTQIPEGLAEGISSGETSPAEAISQINGSLQGTFDGLAEIAGLGGTNVVEELSAGIEAGGQQAVEAYNTLIQLIADKATEARTAGETAGSEVTSGQKEKIESGTGEVVQASGAAAKSAAEEATAKYAEGLGAGEESAIKKAADMAKKALDAARAENPKFHNAGYDAALGLAAGINAGKAPAIAAAASMAAAALQAAKSTLKIQSPSKKFRDEVGKQISAGMAFGIRDSASLVGEEAAKMSDSVYDGAKQWLKNYKKKLKKGEKLSRQDIRYYWKQVAKHTKEGTEAYNKAVANMVVASVSTTKVTGSGKKKKTVKKDTGSYNNEILSAASQMLENRKTINDWSVEEELSYWNIIQSKLKKGTQAWYDAQKKINQIKQNIGTVGNMQSLLSNYKTYYELSEKAEMQYWDAVRQQYESGTEERIEADEKYLDAKEKYTKKLKELEEDYADELEKVNKELKDGIDELNKKYADELKNRADEIKSAFGLFDEFVSESESGKTLLFNIKAQAAGYEDWMNQLDELGSKGILDDELMKELTEQGPEISAEIHALNSLTAEELKEFNDAYLKKIELSMRQAEDDTADLKNEVERQTEELNAQAERDLAEIKEEYAKNIESVNTNINTQLEDLANKTKTIADDMTARLVAAITGQPVKDADVQGSVGASSSSEETGDSEAQSNQQMQNDEQQDKILNIIKSGKYVKSMSASERKKHVPLYLYLLDNYHRTPSTTVYRNLGSALGVKVSSKPTSAQKTEMLKKLKKKGYKSGGRNIQDELTWMDEELKRKGPELQISRSDNAILTRIKPGTDIINADTTSNLLRIAKIDPDKLMSVMRRQQEAATEYLNSMNAQAGIASLNRIMNVGATAKQPDIDVSRVEAALDRIELLMQKFLPMMENPVPAVVDLDRLVKETYKKTGTELSMDCRRRRG